MKKIYITKESEYAVRVWCKEKPVLHEDGYFYGDMDKTFVFDNEQSELLFDIDASCIKDEEVVEIQIISL